MVAVLQVAAENKQVSHHFINYTSIDLLSRLRINRHRLYK